MKKGDILINNNNSELVILSIKANIVETKMNNDESDTIFYDHINDLKKDWRVKK